MLLQTTTTITNAEVLIEIALQSKLTPCIQQTEIQSHYFWYHSTNQNSLEVCHEKEILLSFKVFKQDFKTLRRLILQHHSYEIPEIVGIKLKQISKAYKKWCQKIKEK